MIQRLSPLAGKAARRQRALASASDANAIDFGYSAQELSERMTRDILGSTQFSVS